MDDCIFCKIVAGEIPANKIYEDDKTLAFLDINPNNPGHTLVIPKEHTRNIFTIAEPDLQAVMRTVRTIAPAVMHGVHADALNLAMNNEPVSGQEVFHAHLHLIPRFADDGYRHWPHKPYKEGEAEKVAEAIRADITK